MAKRVQKKKITHRDTHADKQYDTITAGEHRRLQNETVDRQHKNLKPKQDKLDKLDELMDEIDEVLEENAEEFVSSYIQQGGE